MRIMVFFDLPTHTEEYRRIYTKFRKFLIQDGYDMVQYSVYGRICANLDSAEAHYKRLANHAPREGSVRVMLVTNRQYADMRILVGQVTAQEKLLQPERLTLF